MARMSDHAGHSFDGAIAGLRSAFAAAETAASEGSAEEQARHFVTLCQVLYACQVQAAAKRGPAVIRLRDELAGREPVSLSQLGARLGLSKSRVYQILEEQT